MPASKPAVLTAVVICTVLAAAQPAAAFVAVDTFDDLALGPIDDQDGWYAADASSEVTLDPEDAHNQVLTILTESTFLFHAALVPEGEARTLFLRFRYEDQLSVSFGMSESTFPDQFGNFEPELSLTNATDDLRINDGGTYTELAVLRPGVWYNCWLYVDNAADVTLVWLHDRPWEAATGADLLTVDGRCAFPFRQGTGNDLRNLFVKTGGGDGVVGPLRLDDIHLSASGVLDLTNPAAPVAAVVAPAASLRLDGAWPNPFNPRTTIGFTVGAPQTVVASVHDARGRLVRRLFAGPVAAGDQRVVWDGRDEHGGEAASGVYLVRVVGEGAAVGTKVLLNR